MLNQHGDNSLTRINYQSSIEIDHSLEWEVYEYICIFSPFPDFYNTSSGLLLRRSFLSGEMPKGSGTIFLLFSICLTYPLYCVSQQHRIKHTYIHASYLDLNWNSIRTILSQALYLDLKLDISGLSSIHFR